MDLENFTFEQRLQIMSDCQAIGHSLARRIRKFFEPISKQLEPIVEVEVVERATLEKVIAVEIEQVNEDFPGGHSLTEEELSTDLCSAIE